MRTVDIASHSSGALFWLTPESTRTPGLDLSPTSAMLFPWLSQIATRYERYQFHSLSVELISSSPTSLGGRVYLAIDYDYNDAPATSAQTMMSNRSCVEGPVWSNLTLRADPKELHPDMPFKYCNAITKGNFVEPRTAYAGFLMIAAAGIPFGETPVVDLWVTYDVTLRLPVLETYESGTAEGAHELGVFPEILGATGSFHMPNVSPSASSLVPVVVPGSQGVPAMTIDGVALSRAVDLSRAAMTGLSKALFETTITKSGVKPVDLYTTLTGLKPQFTLYGEDGRRLGDWTDEGDLAFSTVGDPADAAPANWQTNGGGIRVAATLGLSKILSTFPLAKYLAPLWRSGFAVTGIDRSSRMQWEL